MSKTITILTNIIIILYERQKYLHSESEKRNTVWYLLIIYRIAQLISPSNVIAKMISHGIDLLLRVNAPVQLI